jgi:hypothetical protein
MIESHQHYEQTRGSRGYLFREAIGEEFSHAAKELFNTDTAGSRLARSRFEHSSGRVAVVGAIPIIGGRPGLDIVHLADLDGDTGLPAEFSVHRVMTGNGDVGGNCWSLKMFGVTGEVKFYHRRPLTPLDDESMGRIIDGDPYRTVQLPPRGDVVGYQGIAGQEVMSLDLEQPVSVLGALHRVTERLQTEAVHWSHTTIREPDLLAVADAELQQRYQTQILT